MGALRFGFREFKSLKMVKVLLAGLLAAEGGRGCAIFPASWIPCAILRSDNSGCCTKITIAGAKNSNANGVYNAVMSDSDSTKGKLANGFMYYMSEDGKAVCHHHDKAWICAAVGDCKVPGTADCANPMHGFSAIATNQGCIINQMTSTMAWQSAYDWLNRGTETFRIDSGFKMTCQADVNQCLNDAYNSCPTGSQCTNTKGGYDCTCQPGKTCEDFDQCGPNGGGVCPPGSSCLEGSTLDKDSNGYSCSCDAGYTHNSTTKACDDNDECNVKDFKGCDFRPNSECKNTAGSFTCECPDKKFSTDKDGNCVDFDECKENKHDCGNFANTLCRNTVGSWECDCPVGFTGNKTTCANIDECSNNPNPCGEHQDCTDKTPVNGSAGYECKCKTGFNTNTDGSCSDINECAAMNVLAICDPIIKSMPQIHSSSATVKSLSIRLESVWCSNVLTLPSSSCPPLDTLWKTFRSRPRSRVRVSGPTLSQCPLTTETTPSLSLDKCSQFPFRGKSS